MNIIEAIRIWSDHLSNYIRGRDEFWKAQEHINSLVKAYDDLAPDWTQAPKNAQAYTIDMNGEANYMKCDVDPTGDGVWGDLDDMCDPDSPPTFVVLPLGIDWRLCIWQRPEAQP